MKWRESGLNIYKGFQVYINSFIEINRSIPDDIFHLEFDSIDIINEHDPYRYLYILTDKLSDYNDDDNVLMIDKFLIKNRRGELIETFYNINDYISRY